MRGWSRARAARWSLGLGALFVWLGWADRSSGFGVRLLVLGIVLLIVPVVVWTGRAENALCRTSRSATRSAIQSRISSSRCAPNSLTRTSAVCS